MSGKSVSLLAAALVLLPAGGNSFGVFASEKKQPLEWVDQQRVYSDSTLE
jgi:hypothetical protein